MSGAGPGGTSLWTGRLEAAGPAERVVGGPGWLAWQGPDWLALRQDGAPTATVVHGLAEGATIQHGPDHLCVDAGPGGLRWDRPTGAWRWLGSGGSARMPAPGWVGATGRVLRAGDRLVRVALGGAHRDRPPLPEGAEGRGLRPWTAGTGWSWADEDLVFRCGADGQVRCVGRSPGVRSAVQAGPHGALARHGADRSWVAPAGQGLRPVPPVPPGLLCWDPAGRRAHLWTEGARGWLCGRTGALQLAGDGRLPVGADRAHCPDQGDVQDADGQTILEGLRPAPLAVGAAAVVGPGGRAWGPAGVHPLPAAPVRGDRVVVAPWGFALLTRRAVWRLDPAGQPLGPAVPLGRRTGRALDARSDQGALCFLTTRGAFALGPTAERPVPCAPERLSGPPPAASAPPPGWWVGTGGLLLSAVRPVATRP